MRGARVEDEVDYPYHDAAPDHTAAYLWPAVLEILAAHAPRRVLDLGCGNGALAHELCRRGYEIVGVDPSASGIEVARRAHPDLELHRGSAYDDLGARFGRFPAVVSLEVVEHLYDPRRYAATIFDLLEPGGVAILSTPFHGYWKNLALAVSGKLDAHFTALWDHGHIKFWSMRSLRTLLEEAGLGPVEFRRVGRVPALAKSLIAVARRPS